MEKNKSKDFISLIFKKNKSYLKNFFKKVFEILKKPEMMVLPGQLAFFVILSLVPMVSLISWIGNMLGVNIETVTEILNKVFTNIKFDLIIPNLFGSEINIQFIIAVIITFCIAANGTNSIIVASNQIYGIKQGNYFKRRIKAMIMTLLLCVLYIFILVVPLLGNKIMSSFNYFELEDILNPILAVIRGPITWIIIYLFLKSLYVMAPDKEVEHKGINLGALFTTVFWLIATYLYSGWINNFSKYDRYYGSLSSLAILMLWVYWLCYIFVVGLCLNVKVENEEISKPLSIKRAENKNKISN